MKLDRTMRFNNLFVISFIIFALIPAFAYINGFLGPDESCFMFIGNSLIHGSILYKDFIDNKPPGIFYLNALIFLLFGKSFYVSRIVLFIVNGLSGLIIYRLGKDLWNERVGQLSCILFLVSIYHPLIDGYFVLTDQYMVFFGLLGIFTLFRYSRHSGVTPPCHNIFHIRCQALRSQSSSNP